MTDTKHEIEPIALPSLPSEHADWISYVSARPDTPMQDLIAPYKEYDSKLREIFAQQPDHPAIAKSSIVPIFTGQEHEVKIRARNLKAETEAESQRYLIPLSGEDRKPNGAPAVVTSLKEFQTNFQLFSESSLVDMDWSNVVAAGSAVVTSLLPVPEKHNVSKRALREYYHQQLAPASDVDLFLYGLTEEQALEKIKQIEQRIRDSILTETTTIRTKNAITIASQYPTRHVQIVLRIYRSVSEILTGFDVDCSCAAYDGKQVYASPRALGAYMTQINTIDLTRRSPSYENRLSKYARRGFEVYWPSLDRSRIDPTIFERSFSRTLGLARLLILEKLPKNADREAYVDQRRRERGRPAINRWNVRKLGGNMKDEHDDEIAEWVETDEVSDYHTFTIPYGPKYGARKIERLLYAKDLLLNAEWNRPKERETTLHRHPAFFGSAADVIGDCCGYCPKPTSVEEEEIAEEEGKTYVSGELTFIKDDPGRQAIGSFHPLTDDDWTEMAYVGNTARLCQAIVERDLEHVQDWLKQEGADPNLRDYTGRTPLHLAVISSTPEIVQCLIDAGARITSRIVDGKTALHLAAMRGETAMVRALLIKSDANEEMEAEKLDARRAARKASSKNAGEVADETKAADQPGDAQSVQSESDSIDMLDDETENFDATTENSMVRIDRKQDDAHDSIPEDEDKDEPDVYDVNAVAWDAPVSALHLAIANGHMETVKVLVQDFGADLLLPVKLLNDYNKSPRAAILPVVLALQLEPAEAQEMTKLLINLGASPAQADVEQVTALQYFTASGTANLKTMIAADRPASQRAVNHLTMSSYRYSPDASSALHYAIKHGDVEAVDVLLELGAKPEVDFASYMTSYKRRWDTYGTSADNEKDFRQECQQPIMTAIKCELPSVVSKLLDAGADVNSLNTAAYKVLNGRYSYNEVNQSVLDAVREKIHDLRGFLDTGMSENDKSYSRYSIVLEPIPLKPDEHYLECHQPGSYAHWSTTIQLEKAKSSYEEDLKKYNEYIKKDQAPAGTEEKKAAVKALLAEFEGLESQLVERGAKTLLELHPDTKIEERSSYNYRSSYDPVKPKPWLPNLSFTLSDLTEEQRVAYLKVFQACWEGDLSTIKEYTLAIWGENQSPLKIAVDDSNGFSPFSTALLRGHFDVAKGIVEIADAQYKPEGDESRQKKHSLHNLDPDEDDESMAGTEDDIQIYSQIVDDRFTVDNIGVVQSQVKSKISPLTMIQWNCPVMRFVGEEDSGTTTVNSTGEQYFWNRRSYRQREVVFDRGDAQQVIKDARNNRTYHVESEPKQEIEEIQKPRDLIQFAIYLGDLKLLQFLLELCEEYTLRNVSPEVEHPPKYYRMEEADFLYAIRLGRTDILEEIIKFTGAGIPLDDLIKKSGVELEVAVKPKHYQGLSVYGKKRADWANAGREVHAEQPQAQHPPLLHAAKLASTTSVEWFLSDGPLRCYQEFAESHPDDKRIQNLKKAKKGLAGSISKWLGLREHLLIHCVVLSKTTSESLKLLRHLCTIRPEAIEHKSSNGSTPLHLAFSMHRVEMIKVLLEAGADQTCRDNEGNNILHSMLRADFTNEEKDLPRLRKLFELIDPRLLPSLFTERTNAVPGAATPLASWLYKRLHSSYNDYGTRTYADHGPAAFLKLIFEYSKGDDLSLVNSEGDTPLHAAVRYCADPCLEVMLECRPELLYRENATGRTPAEMAEDAYLTREVFRDPPSLEPNSNYGRDQRRQLRRIARDTDALVTRSVDKFVRTPWEERNGVERVWDVVKEMKGKAGGAKRKLVSLLEANEVAKRLAARKGLGVGGGDGVEVDVKSVDSDGEEKWYGDEVDSWCGVALRADES